MLPNKSTMLPSKNTMLPQRKSSSRITSVHKRLKKSHVLFLWPRCDHSCSRPTCYLQGYVGGGVYCVWLYAQMHCAVLCMGKFTASHTPLPRITKNIQQQKKITEKKKKTNKKQINKKTEKHTKTTQAAFEPPQLQLQRLDLKEWHAVVGALQLVITRVASMESLLHVGDMLTSLHDGRIRYLFQVDVIGSCRRACAVVAGACHNLADAILQPPKAPMVMRVCVCLFVCVYVCACVFICLCVCMYVCMRQKPCSLIASLIVGMLCMHCTTYTPIHHTHKAGCRLVVGTEWRQLHDALVKDMSSALERYWERFTQQQGAGDKPMLMAPIVEVV